MGRSKNINTNRSLEAVDFNPNGCLWGPHTLYSYFSEEVTANVLEIARELKVEPKEMTKLLQSHDRLWTCKELVLVNEQKKRFLDIESILMKALWRMLKVFKEFRIAQNLMKQQQSLRGLTSIFKEALMCVKCFETTPSATRNNSKKELIDRANLIVVLFYEIAIATPTFSNHHPDQSAAINIKARPSTSEKITTC